jgi:divalent metal cation (Fe/Co/Zn/Cd) transporter
LWAFEHYEKQETALSLGVSLLVGLVGVAFLAGAVFSYLAKNTILFIVLTICASIGCGLPYFLYQRIKREKVSDLTPKIEQKYNVVYQICEQAKSSRSA